VQLSPRHTVYTGSIDAYFDYRFGKLPYRSLRLEHEHLSDTERLQPVGTVNYPNEHAYTRFTEFKHATGQTHTGTSIVREYPQAEGDPYYTRYRGRKTRSATSATRRWPKPNLTSPSSGGWCSTVTTTWIKSWPRP
jgi:UDP-galactopyranose mutase